MHNPMQSSSLLNEGAAQAAAAMTTSDRSDLSKQLFSQINWQEILKNGVFLSHRDHQLLERAQADLASVLSGPEEDARALCSILVKIAENCNSNLTIQQYVFVRIEEVLCPTASASSSDGSSVDGTHRRALLFGDEQGRAPAEAFLKAVRSADPIVQRASSVSLACLLVHLKGDVAAFVHWLAEQLSAEASLELTLPALCIVVRSQTAREALAASNGIALVVQQLYRIGVNGNAQHMYELAFCLWTVSLDRAGDLTAFLSSGAIRILSDMLASAPSRKVVRVALATLHNLAALNDEAVLTEMLTSGLQRQIESMIRTNAHTQSGDPEVEADAKALADSLLRNFRDLSTFERWASEATSGSLRWGVVHSEKFWRENAKLLEADDFKLLKRVIALAGGEDPLVVSIALYDLGEWTRFYPNGRGVTKSLGGKDLAMRMIEHANTDIQRSALQCVSKIMVTNWEFMR